MGLFFKTGVDAVMYVRILVMCLAVSGLLLHAFPARSDDAPLIYKGGSASPKQSHPRIRMESEEVIIRLGKSTYTVDAVFRFFNTGDTVTEWVGFPKRAQGYDDSFFFESIPDFIRFETWIDGKKVAFSEDSHLAETSRRRESGGLVNFVTDSRWLVKHVTFPGRKTTTTRVTYEAPYSGPGGAACYIYGTGSYWKGSIGRATFTIDASEVGKKVPVGAGFLFPDAVAHVIRSTILADSVITYEILDFDPVPDGELRVRAFPEDLK